MSQASRSSAARSARRDFILAGATDYFFECGLLSSNMNELAARLDLGKPSIYRIFGSRSGLETAIFEPVIQMVESSQTMPYTGAGSHMFQILEMARKNRKAALLVLRDCRTSPAHVHWFDRLTDTFTANLLVAYRPAPDAPPGGKARGAVAARSMARFYADCLAEWLEDRDGLTDEARAQLFKDVVTAWWTTARSVHQLGTIDRIFPKDAIQSVRRKAE